MKRLLSICFAAILVFNLCGYRLLILFLQQQHQQTLTEQINGGIEDADLISVKVPATLPYYTNSKDFQWTNGEVEIDGTVYQYVKRRIYNDSIEYLCLQDLGKTRLLNARDQFFQLAHDLTKQKSGNANPQVKPLMLEYCDWDKVAANAPDQAEKEKSFCAPFFILPQACRSRPAQPPEAGC